ncbi:hypothetical protein M9H77_11841 [Catharanthus roseus]|uniref:Uncharacterized protein n=1 Tax=Catharanthus roseus TaxID=4058 RepID=A0ACC0BFT0_CATRO|nr:hypothetical protein M9H77_11841 [Catharanthus roseus]
MATRIECKLKDYKWNQGLKQWTRALLEQLQRRTRARFGIWCLELKKEEHLRASNLGINWDHDVHLVLSVVLPTLDIGVFFEDYLLLEKKVLLQFNSVEGLMGVQTQLVTFQGGALKSWKNYS